MSADDGMFGLTEGQRVTLRRAQRGAASESLRAENERLTIALQDIADELLQVEQHCPCGARPETPRTHPHVSGCPVAEALRIWHDAFGGSVRP